MTQKNNSYPFSAISGQGEMKLSLLLNLVDSNVGGVYICGSRGSGKSTAVRALSEILPQIDSFKGDPYSNKPDKNQDPSLLDKIIKNSKLIIAKQIPFVDLPLGTTEDRLFGTIDIEKALTSGEKSFEPGILASVNNGILYIDEVNLLEDHLVDNLLDSAASGITTVECEGVSIRHPAKFILIGSGNPEEGELRPQLADRFGLYVDVTTPRNLDDRLQITKRRTEFDENPKEFLAKWSGAQKKLKQRIRRARQVLPKVVISGDMKEKIGQICRDTEVDGLRGDLVLTRAASAHAALHGRTIVNPHDIYCVATLCLWHRMQSDPMKGSENSFLEIRCLKFQRISLLILKYFPDATDYWNDGFFETVENPIDAFEGTSEKKKTSKNNTFLDDYSFNRIELEDMEELAKRKWREYTNRPYPD